VTAGTFEHNSNIGYINTWPRFIVLTSKDENKIITKLSPFILEKWLKSTVEIQKSIGMCSI
jgi:hypothetical protein